jgi:hypothetical protein
MGGWDSLLVHLKFRCRVLHLFQNFGSEAGKCIVFHVVIDLDWIAANFTIFDISLTTNRKVQDHRNFFPTVRAIEKMLHWN